MKVTEHEMRGLLAGKCVPGDMMVNEELPAYLVRKFAAIQQKLDARGDTLDERAEIIHAYSKTQREFAEQLNCDSDNESILKAIHTLQQKLDALSRECGMMSGLLNDISRYHEECTHDDQMHALIPLEYVSAINGFVERDVDGENPCPLTDAFLSAVRAEGVDLYAQALRRQQEDAVTQSEHRHTRLGRAAVFAEEFANKLRAGHTEGPTHD